MKKFDQKIDEYFKQIILNEEEGDPTLSGFIRSITAPITTGKPSFAAKYNPANVYYLYGGHKNLPTLRQKLGKLLNITEAAAPMPVPPSPASTTPDPATVPAPTTPTASTTGTKSTKEEETKPTKPIFGPTGEILNYNEFATRLYNAFDEAGELNRNYITLNELNRGYLRPTGTAGKTHGGKEEIGEFANIPKEKAHASIMQFINNTGLSDILLYVKPEQIPELDKGGYKKRLMTAFDVAAGKALQGLGKEMTTGQINYI